MTLVIPSEVEVQRSDEVREARLSIPLQNRNLISRDPSTPLRSAQDDNKS